MYERPCYKCGAAVMRPTKAPRVVCEGCRAPERPRVHRLVDCTNCGKTYSTRSGNRVCPACQHQAAKHPCAECAKPCDKRATLCLACLSRINGPTHHNWKGGRTQHTLHGYVRIKMRDHPRAAKDGYVREHQIVMEQHLGRYLLPGENVHHKNGDRADNRIENLELWRRAQPAGQRVEDLLAWAREIIAEYEPIEARL